MIKTMKAVLLLATLFIGSVELFASDPYQSETGVFFSYGKAGELKGNFLGLGQEYFFNPVKTENHPLAESAFLEKASSVSLISSRTILKEDDNDSTAYDYGADLCYVLPQLPIAFSGSAMRTEGDIDSGSFSWDYTINELSAGIGFFISYGLFTGIEYTRTMEKMTFDDESVKTNTNTLEFYGKYVLEFNNSNAINLEASYSYNKSKTDDDFFDDEKVQIYNFGFDFYFVPQAGIGGEFEYEKSDIKDNGEKSFEIRATAFPIDRVNLGAYYRRTMYEDSDDDDRNLVGMSALIRF